MTENISPVPRNLPLELKSFIAQRTASSAHKHPALASSQKAIPDPTDEFANFLLSPPAYMLSPQPVPWVWPTTHSRTELSDPSGEELLHEGQLFELLDQSYASSSTMALETRCQELLEDNERLSSILQEKEKELIRTTLCRKLAEEKLLAVTNQLDALKSQVMRSPSLAVGPGTSAASKDYNASDPISLADESQPETPLTSDAACKVHQRAYHQAFRARINSFQEEVANLRKRKGEAELDCLKEEDMKHRAINDFNRWRKRAEDQMEDQRAALQEATEVIGRLKLEVKRNARLERTSGCRESFRFVVAE